MSSHTYLLMNIGFAVFMILLFLIGRNRRKDPSRLRLRENDQKPQAPLAKNNEPESRVLNVIFIHNGHSFDAHEVIGAPAGANIEVIREAYQQTLRRIDPESRPVVDAAYHAILAKLKN